MSTQGLEQTQPDHPDFGRLLHDLQPWPNLSALVQGVLCSLPQHVQRDFLTDPRFRITFEDYHPERGWRLWLPTPGPPGEGTRCVVLRLRLGECEEHFSRWVIAHELAHAFLRNGGWNEISDPEAAADALAESWGYPRPPGSWRDFLKGSEPESGQTAD